MIASVSSAMGMNVDGGTGPERGVVPAQQRLDADDVAAGEVDLWLVDEMQLTAVESDAELGRERQPCGGSVVQPAGEPFGPSRPASLAAYMALSASRTRSTARLPR